MDLKNVFFAYGIPKCCPVTIWHETFVAYFTAEKKKRRRIIAVEEIGFLLASFRVYIAFSEFVGREKFENSYSNFQSAEIENSKQLKTDRGEISQITHPTPTFDIRKKQTVVEIFPSATGIQMKNSSVAKAIN
ncbi:conserved hypothetical protein [Trichinella spiralis]|uniref:hypothetical protein n=1 Tax=Trichinella spiralis TaxID=6334 RepID=UPI0001EFDB39|nr:conserved hypothetical protein [Trichinella spiralis]